MTKKTDSLTINKNKDKKRTFRTVDFAVPADHKVKKKRRVHGPCLRTKKAVKHESDGDTSCNWCTWNGPQSFGKRGTNLDQ